MEKEEKEQSAGWQYDFDEEYGENNEFVEETPVLTRAEQEEQVKQTLRDLWFGIAIGVALVLAIGNLILRGHLRFTLGVLFGAVIAAGLAGFMYHSVLVATEYPEKQAAGYMKRSSLLRMVIMIAAIVLAIYFLQVYGLFGTILGILTLKFSALTWPVIHKYNPFGGKDKSRR